jgi:acetyl esterase/lipase
VRVYSPAVPVPDRGRPALLDIHGGGFPVGGMDMEHGFAVQVSRELGAVVVVVGYRRAPEHPFPAPSTTATPPCRGCTKALTRSASAAPASVSAGRAPAAVWPPALYCSPATAVAHQCASSLRDEGILYALRMMEAGVPVEQHTFPGTFHGSAAVPTAAVSRRAHRELLTALRRGLKVDQPQ